MKKILIPALGASLLALAGCGSSDDGAPVVPAGPKAAAPKLASGAYTVLASGDSAGFGEAFYNASGNAYIVLASDDRAPAAIVYKVENGQAKRMPAADKDVTLVFDSSTSTGFTALDLAALAGSYQAMVGAEPVAFTLDSKGVVAAGASACKASGKLDPAAVYGQAIAAQLSFSGCSGVAGNVEGIAFSRSDYAAASLRVVATDGSKAVDFFAYK